MRRHALIVFVIWIVLSIVGEILVRNANIFPAAAAEEADHIDAAIRLLLMLAIPVFMFVVTVVGYSILNFRASDESEEGPAIYGHQAFSTAWLVITTALAALLFYNPGYTGWSFLQSRPNEDLIVKVTAAQWHWHITYPQYDLSIKSRPIGFERMAENTVMALPADQRIKFEVTADDVIHSFWIPAFRMKVDAVPGLVTTMYVTPNRVGSFEEDFSFRVQCAELCGTGHPRMNMRVTVMEPAEFEKWIAEQKQMQEMGGMPMPMEGEEGDHPGDGH